MYVDSLAERFAKESDGLSRQAWILKHQLGDLVINELIKNGVVKMQNDVWVHVFRQQLNGTPLFPVVVPAELKENVLRTIHDQAGHLGVRKTTNRGRDNFWWKGMSKDIKKHCLTCGICQQVKGVQKWKTSTGEPGRVFVEGRSWSVVGVDTVKGIDGILLTATCLYTRYAFASIINSEKACAISTALERIFAVEGAPAVVVSDNGTYFHSNEFQSLLRKWSVVGRFTPRYSPFYGGFYEISHRSLILVLTSIVQETKENWRRKSPEALMYYNMRCYENTEGIMLSPHEVFRGRKLVNPWNTATMNTDEQWPSDQVVRDATVAVMREREEIGEMYEDIWKRMREASMREMNRRIKKKDGFEEGDFVYVWVPKELRANKISLRWDGPFRVEKVLGPTRYLVGQKEEHSYNLKKALYAAAEGQEIEGGGERTERSDVSEGGTRKRTAEPDEEQVKDTQNTNAGYGMMTRSKRRRLAGAVTHRPKGDLMWL